MHSPSAASSAHPHSTIVVRKSSVEAEYHKNYEYKKTDRCKTSLSLLILCNTSPPLILALPWGRNRPEPKDRPKIPERQSVFRAKSQTKQGLHIKCQSSRFSKNTFPLSSLIKSIIAFHILNCLLVSIESFHFSSAVVALVFVGVVVVVAALVLEPSSRSQKPRPLI